MPKPDDLAIHTTAESGDLSELQRLLERNPDLLEAKGFMGRTPLHDAVQSGSTECILYLLLKGADINAAAEYNGHTPIFSATNLDIVKLLVSRGARTDIVSTHGNNLLSLACRSLNLDLVHYLIKELAFDVNYKKDLDCYSTMLQTAIQDISSPAEDLEKSIAVCTQLLEAGADPNDRNVYEETALHQACRWNQLELVKLLLKYGADPNLRDSNKKTCFDSATEYPSIIEVLRPHWNPVPLPAKIKQTPEQLIERLLKIGIIFETDLIPCTEDEIAALEYYHDVVLPEEFKRYLRIMGRGGGDIIDSNPIFTDYYSFLIGDFDNDPLKDYEVEQLELASLPEHYFEFYGKFEDRHFYFVADGKDDNPPVFMYEFIQEQVVHEKICDSFWDFFEIELESLEFSFDRKKFCLKDLDASIDNLRQLHKVQLAEERMNPRAPRKKATLPTL